MTTVPDPIETSDPAELAAAIHNDVLQSLGVAVLGVDLCRRFQQQQRYEMALDEITGIADALSLALAASERLLPDLNWLLSTSRRSIARPSMVVMDDLPDTAPTRVSAAGRPLAPQAMPERPKVVSWSRSA
ncbi:MAG TPA: hypothetical protein VFH48_22665 [Chloroflexota bacterium]|nr:hypothetical protein [Chloroflexota bacterium]